MEEAPLIFYAKEDDRILTILRKHLFTLEIVPEQLALHIDTIGTHLKQIRDEQPIIILVSVDSLVIFKWRMETLAQMIQRRQQRFGLNGVVSVICRPCAWTGTTFEKTEVFSHPDYVPITSKGKIDQACLDVATRMKGYLLRWDKALQRERMSPEEQEQELAALYGPSSGSGEYQKGETITFAGLLSTGNRPSELTGKIIYTPASDKYVVQVPGEIKHHIVYPCDVIERKERH